MATSREYFEKNQYLEYGVDFDANIDGSITKVRVKVAYDFDGGSKFIRAYVPECERPEAVIYAIASSLDKIWKEAAGLKVTMGFSGTNESVEGDELKFSGRLLVYTPCLLEPDRWQSLKSELLRSNVNLLVRDATYTSARDRLEKPRAFISHDSRDKEPFVAGLALKLTTMLCPVWYDEYQLKPGQSLRESIEAGLKACPKCIVILSKNFFSNTGWTKREFDSIYTREVIEGKTPVDRID